MKRRKAVKEKNVKETKQETNKRKKECSMSILWQSLCHKTFWNPVRETTEQALGAAGAYWTVQRNKE